MLAAVAMRSSIARRRSGFTLLELIVTIVITGIVASMLAIFIVKPIQGYTDLGRRAALVDAAESALRRMARDLRLALPNSVRVSNTAGGFALELLPIIDGAKYSSKGPSRLRFGGQGAQSFGILGCFHKIVPGTYSDYRIVINNLGTNAGTQSGSGNDAYIGLAPGIENTITPLGFTIVVSYVPNLKLPGPYACPTTGNHHIDLYFPPGTPTPHKFTDSSPQNRLFVVSTPITYLCDKAGGTLTLYKNYPIQATQPTTAAALNALPGVTSSLVADLISDCSVSTTTQDIRNRGLVTLNLSLSQANETIRLLHQVQLDNSR